MSDGRMQPHVEAHLRATYTLKCMLARGFTSVRDVVSITPAVGRLRLFGLCHLPRIRLN
jgi:hypothetical protein